MELLDVLDKEGNMTGKVEDKDVIHEKALWHKEVDAWIVNEQGEILIQKRAATKKQAPNKWVTTGGHVKSGEDVKEAMAREIKEEIGLDCKKEKLDLILIAKHRSYRGDNNVFRYLYFYRTEKQLQDFILEKREVSELKYISIQELEHIVENKDKNYLFWREEYIQDVIHYLKKNIYKGEKIGRKKEPIKIKLSIVIWFIIIILVLACGGVYLSLRDQKEENDIPKQENISEFKNEINNTVNDANNNNTTVQQVVETKKLDIQSEQIKKTISIY